MRRMIIGTLLAAATAPAFAGDTFFVMRGDQLYRYDGNSTSQFTMNDTVHSLSATSNGIIGVSNLQINPGDPPPRNYEVWRLDHGLSAAPVLTQVGNSIDQRYTTLTEINGTLYGLGEGEIYTLDNAFNRTFVANLTPGEAIGGSGYDSVSGNLYVTGPTTDSFFIQNLDGTRSLVGALGFDFRNQGGEWWNGQYWAALEDVANDRLILGTISTLDGSFTLETVLQQGLGDLGSNQTVGLAVIPSPSSVALLGLGGLVATRRRR